MPEYEFDGKRPTVHPEAYVAPTAILIGDVRVGAGASIWFGAVLRGDDSHIEVGEGSNVQDNAVVHCSANLPTIIGRNSSLGHLACIEGCVVEDGALVGTGSIMLHRSRLGAGSVLAAGSVLLEGQEIPAGSLAAGVPATIKKELSGASADWVSKPAVHYRPHGAAYRKSLRRLD
jgi:carbonic anhydrase/acetyltransferase-like protein (isoleucine patch superfamily)